MYTLVPLVLTNNTFAVVRKLSLAGHPASSIAYVKEIEDKVSWRSDWWGCTAIGVVHYSNIT